VAEPLTRVDSDGPVAVLQMVAGKANALDTELCRDLVRQLGDLERGGARAVVLTGQGAIFCAGVDLFRVHDGGPGYLDEFLPALSAAFLALFNGPLPVVAAVNGHAIAGGCILVSACDRRVMNSGRGRIGVTELLVGVPFPVAALEILRFAAGTRRLAELTYFGRTYAAADAAALGLIDEAVEEAAVLPRAIEIAGQLAALPPESLRHTRRQIRGPAMERIARQRSSDDAVRQIWRSPAARRAIGAYVERVLRHG
jgi:enoyl-CoA hydratase